MQRWTWDHFSSPNPTHDANTRTTQPNPSHVLEIATQRSATHGRTQPMSISGLMVRFTCVCINRGVQEKSCNVSSIMACVLCISAEFSLDFEAVHCLFRQYRSTNIHKVDLQLHGTAPLLLMFQYIMSVICIYVCMYVSTSVYLRIHYCMLSITALTAVCYLSEINVGMCA